MPVANGAALQRPAQGGIGDDRHEDGRHASGEEERQGDIQGLERAFSSEETGHGDILLKPGDQEPGLIRGGGPELRFPDPTPWDGSKGEDVVVKTTIRPTLTGGEACVKAFEFDTAEQVAHGDCGC